MEKPRKKEVFPCPFCGNVIFDEFIWKGRRRVQCNNQICPIHGFQMDIDDWNTRAMSTWLEGEVPTEKDILEIINNPPMEKVTKYAESEAWMCDGEIKLAQAIHSMLLRKLTGEV